VKGIETVGRELTSTLDFSVGNVFDWTDSRRNLFDMNRLDRRCCVARMMDWSD